MIEDTQNTCVQCGWFLQHGKIRAQKSIVDTLAVFDI